MLSVENEAGFPELADIIKNLRDAAKLRLTTHYSPAEPPLGRSPLNAVTPLIVQDLARLVDRTSLAASALIENLNRSQTKTGTTTLSLELAAQTLPAAARACLHRMVSGAHDAEPQAQHDVRTVRAVAESGHAMAFT